MNQKDFTRRVASVLRGQGARKNVAAYRQVFHISDDYGNHKDFIIKKDARKVVYTADDVDVIVKACVQVILEALSQGKSVSFMGFGSLGLNLVKEKRIKNVIDGQMMTIPEHYVPKFVYGKDIKMSAKLYNMTLEENQDFGPEPLYEEDILSDEYVGDDKYGEDGDY